MVNYVMKANYIFILISTSLCFVIYFTLFTDLKPKQNKISHQVLQPESTENLQNASLYPAGNKQAELVILLWTWPNGHKFSLDRCMPQYGIAGCHLTTNRSMYKQADAVVIHHKDVSSNISLLPPQPRPPHQLWIWFNMEPPIHLSNLHLMDNLFNLTLSYRQDSDIFSPYGWVENVSNPGKVSIPKKSKLVSWVISNWRPSDKRVQYYEELRKHIPVDVFGKEHMPIPDSTLLTTIISRYKFYLAFENSQHKDYITEKVWRNAFDSMAVPVVLGPTRANYELFLPPHSFIHINDFPTVQDLAAYLLDLDVDDERYLSYFQWRIQLQPVWKVSWITHYCKACHSLHRKRYVNKTVPSIKRWFI
ncbi:3-galactosyl-N-acetylglucosaminide 4-alpha-L-fucosyltransferase FUT3-like [Lissotriton helveticus]